MPDANIPHGDQANTDRYMSFEALADQAGTGSVLTFTFSSSVDLIWVMSNGATFVSRALTGAQTPTATLGVYCADGTPMPIAGTATVLKVFAPTGATISVWGHRY